MLKNLSVFVFVLMVSIGCDVLDERSSDGTADSLSGGDSSPSYEVESPTSGGTEVSVVLDGGVATRTGAAQYRCWSDGCWQVVWCGHAICEGAWSWTSFPHDGQFTFTWRGVNEKCAGSPPYELRINDEVVKTGEITQWGSCSECPDSTGSYGIFKNYSLGTHQLKKGDKVTLWSKTEFACGIDGPGAYTAHTDIVASGIATN